MKAGVYISLFTIILTFSCNSNKNPKVSKLSDKDHFKKTMVKSQFFTVNTKKDNLIESEKGNVLVIPEGAFLDNNGKEVKGKVKIEFAEASELDEMILSNLIIQDSANKIIKTHLSFYINASKNGEQLRINPQKPVYLEFNANENVKLYRAYRDSLGNMKLGEILETIKYLLPVPLEDLDFLPPGFEQEVEQGLPFRGHTIKTKELVDSLYYSFAAEYQKIINGEAVCKFQGLFPTLNKVDSIYHNSRKKSQEIDTVFHNKENNLLSGLNPASIQSIKNKKFENSLIATKEFESRLKYIFESCDNNVLELYINNLDRNLWEIDEMAAKKLGSSHKLYQNFKNLSLLKQTRVKIKDKHAELLVRYYKRKREKAERQATKLLEMLIEKNEKLNQINDKNIENYNKLLQERLNYRLNKFGFKLTKVGWYNASEVITLNDLEKFELNIKIENGQQFERVYTYVINQKIKSIFSLLSDNNENFNKVFHEDPHLLLWKGQNFKVLSIGYKRDSAYVKIINCIQQPELNINLILEPENIKTVKNLINKFSIYYKNENKITTDLKYQKSFFENRKRLENEKAEEKFRIKLRKIVFPGCSPRYYGSLDFYSSEWNSFFNEASEIFDISFVVEKQLFEHTGCFVNIHNPSIQDLIDFIRYNFGLKYKLENNVCEFYGNVKYVHIWPDSSQYNQIN